MKKVLVYSLLLLVGLAGSQVLPSLAGEAYGGLAFGIRVLTMTGLAFLMIHVGFEFHLDKANLRQYGWDYAVAFTAASFPWVLVTLYFVYVMLPAGTWGDFDAWKETLLAGRFASPTSAGVLFSMLAAAGLGSTWLFRKARILAIFDDLDTVLLMIPLKMLMVGIAWQLGAVVVFLLLLVYLAYALMHRVTLPASWRWVLGYSVAIAVASEVVYAGSKLVDPSVPIHVEVLLPAFVLGCIARPRGAAPGAEPEAAFHHLLGMRREQVAATAVSAAFLVLVGLSMPPLLGGDGGPAQDAQHVHYAEHALDAAAPHAAVVQERHEAELAPVVGITAGQPALGWGVIALHVLAITFLSNLGKMFPAFCYRRQAHWRHRLALSIGMWPRGEVGAGVLVLALGYGVGGPVVTVAILSLALNLVLTGVFILVVRRLIRGVEEVPPSAVGP